MNKILIIDDDNLIVNNMAEFLKENGYTVSTTTDSISAFWIYSEFLPNLVICDIHMPQMDGFELLKRIRTIKPDQKFVMVTGAFLDQTGFNILREYNVPQIIKPPDFKEELLKVVENMLIKDF